MGGHLKHRSKGHPPNIDPTLNLSTALPFHSADSMSASSSTNSLISLEKNQLPFSISPILSTHGESPIMQPAHKLQLPPVESSSSSSSSSSAVVAVLPAASSSVSTQEASESNNNNNKESAESGRNPNVHLASIDALEKQIAEYIYLKKGLSLATQKSLFTLGKQLAAIAAGYGSAEGKYDMYDADAEHNLDLYLQYTQALAQTDTGDSESRKDLLAKLTAIYSKTSTGGNRFPALMKSLLDLYTKALSPKTTKDHKEKENDESMKLVLAAQQVHMPINPVPTMNASSQVVLEFIKTGSVTPLTNFIEEKIKEYPIAYARDKDGVRTDNIPNRMDAKLNFLMMRLQEQIPPKAKDPKDTTPSHQVPNLHLHEVMHCLHNSLETFKDMHKEIGIDGTREAFVTTVEIAERDLENYRGATHAGKLDQARLTVIELCGSLTKLINRFKDGEHPFEPFMAKAYLSTVSAFASLERTEMKLSGSADTIAAANNNNSAKSEKKIKV